MATSIVFWPDVVNSSTHLAICLHRLWSSGGDRDMARATVTRHIQSSVKCIVTSGMYKKDELLSNNRATYDN